jgi:hypothetical protein
MSRQLIQVFDKYQKARREFVQTIAEQASRPENIPNLMAAGVLSPSVPSSSTTFPRSNKPLLSPSVALRTTKKTLPSKLSMRRSSLRSSPVSARKTTTTNGMPAL